MKQLLFLSLCLATVSYAQNPNLGSTAELSEILNFELGRVGIIPWGWPSQPLGTVVTDDKFVHGGSGSARLERDERSPGTTSIMRKEINIDFAGETVEWRGYLRTENVSDFMGLFLRQDGDSGMVASDSMEKLEIKGSRDWNEYSISLPLHPDAKTLSFGVLLSGTGKVWADDMQLFVDGNPAWDAPRIEGSKTVLDKDQEFDGGSRIALSGLSGIQVENLAMLAKIWGFLKYHHPAVTSGNHHWDYELFRIMPRIIAASSREAARAVVRDWIQGLGPVPACTPCATLREEDLHFRPDITWIDGADQVGPELASLLRSIYRNRTRGSQFYVYQFPNVNNAMFDRELAYRGTKFPDAGYQLLSLFRLWNVIQYWFPYRNILEQNWSDVLAEFVPRVALAKDRDAYELEMLALIARITDTHANLWPLSPQVRPPAGDCQLPVASRFINGEAVVVGFTNEAGAATGLNLGDVIETLDGEAVQKLVETWKLYYPASNAASRLRDISRALTRGSCAVVRVGFRRGTEAMMTTAERMPLGTLSSGPFTTHDLPGETFRLLSPDVAYLKLSSVRVVDVARYIEAAKAAKGLVVDIRNYPAQFVAFAVGSHLVEKPTPFARFTEGDLENPGAFRWTEPATLMPQSPHYGGRVVILVDEISQSQAEYTAMAFRSATQAIVVGSTTAGADGNVSQIRLPGGLITRISGIGVFYQDKRPTQRVGIIPDVEAKPTIEGIRVGRDEVLEEALRQILGPSVPPEQILNLAKP